MKLVVACTKKAWEEFAADSKHPDWVRVENISGFEDHKDAEAFFNLDENADSASYPAGLSLLFINSVVTPLKDIPDNKNMVRINGWTGFLKRKTWEIAGRWDERVEKVMEAIGKKSIVVADEPGFISARILAMIINEAYFAKEENVSTEKEIDIAMKLGTNYPKGPFEWISEIGIRNVYSLLEKLKVTDNRYTPAATLKKESI